MLKAARSRTICLIGSNCHTQPAKPSRRKVQLFSFFRGTVANLSPADLLAQLAGPAKTPTMRALWIACWLFLAVGCTKRSNSEALEIVVPTEAQTLDPRYSTRSLDIKLTRLVHAGLTGLNPNSLRPIPLVAKAWKKENMRSWLVELKPGLRFHSGRRLSSRDVCATLLALQDRALASPHRGIVESIGSCERLSPLRLRVRLKRPRATLLTDLEIPILRWDQVRSAPQPQGQLDGLGPFRIASYERGEVKLKPATTGVLSPPHHELVVRSVRDSNARVLRLLAGHADIAPNAVPPGLLPTLERRNELRINSRQGANVTYLLFQNDRSNLKRKEIRLAIAQAIDRKLIVETLLAGRARLAQGIFPSNHWSAPQDLPSVEFRPGRAYAILKELPPLTLLTSTDRSRVTIARALAQMLGDAGLKVEVVSLDLGVMLERLDAGDFDLATLQMPELTEPHLLSWFFHPRGVPGEGGEGRNRARYRSRQAGHLIDRAGKISDFNTRRSLYQQIARLMRNDLPVFPLWHEDQVAVVSKRARSFQLSAEGRWLAAVKLP